MDIAEELMMFSRELPSPGPDTECCRLICCRSVGGGVAGGASGEEREREMPSARATLCLLSGRPLLASFGEDTADNIIIEGLRGKVDQPKIKCGKLSKCYRNALKSGYSIVRNTRFF